MSIPPESIKVGKCYLMETGGVRRVRAILLDGRVQFEHRPAQQLGAEARRAGMRGVHAFAVQALREVPCDWTPETDERGQ
jgi:hypothetical protein